MSQQIEQTRKASIFLLKHNLLALQLSPIYNMGGYLTIDQFTISQY